MFVNVKAYSGGNLIYKVNPYDPDAGTLKGLSYPYLGQGLPAPGPLSANEVYRTELVYEMNPSSTDLTGETKTFHFALGTGRYKDNRIPPAGFTNAAFETFGGVPIDTQGPVPRYPDGQNWDVASYGLPPTARYVSAELYYQSTSKEYVEFLRDENNTTTDGDVLGHANVVSLVADQARGSSAPGDQQA